MRKPTLLALLLLTWLSISTVAAAASVYKCGTTYSQMPCPSGETIKLNDFRSEAQKAQSDWVIVSDKKIANDMAKHRLKQEKLDIAANTPPATAQATHVTSNEATAQPGHKKRKIPNLFVARIPRDKKKSPNTTEVH